MARRRKKSASRRLLGLLLRWIGVALLLSVALVLPYRWIAPPTTAFMLRDHLQRDTPVQHRWVPWPRISRHLAIAVVAAEDQKFPDHHGFDLQSISKALREAPGRGRGASTISQQVAKNLYLWPERSFLRKGIEAYLTLLIENFWPKRRILEIYLNVAEFAPGIYGAGSASRALFGKPASELTAREGATLAAVLPSPRRMSAADPSDYVRQRTEEIQQTVRALGGSSYLQGL